MKSILLIGLGRFGRHIARKLSELRHEVMAVDIDEKRVEAVLPYVTNAQIGDATDEDFIRSLGVRNSTSAWWPLETIFRALWRPRPS